MELKRMLRVQGDELARCRIALRERKDELLRPGINPVKSLGISQGIQVLLCCVRAVAPLSLVFHSKTRCIIFSLCAWLHVTNVGHYVHA